MPTRSKISRPTASRWLKKEEDRMVHLLRYGDLSVDQIARELHRSPEAVRWRIVKIVREHSAGQESTHEAYNWLGLTSDV
jgi:DNA-directed RNA polymerase specialized sigma24 family protein